MSQTALAPTFKSNLPAEFQATPDMIKEFDQVRDTVLFYSFNGQDGVYQDKSIDKNQYDPEDQNLHPRSFDGIILGVTYNRVWLVKPEDNSWSQSWICRAPNVTKPPFLNPELSDEDKARAIAAGVTGECESCLLAQWVGSQKPVCNRGINLLILRDDNQVVLVSFGGNSAIALDKFLSREFKKKGAAWFSWPVGFSRLRETSEKTKKNWYEAKFSRGENFVDAAMVPTLLKFREQYANHTDAREPDADQPRPAAPPRESYNESEFEQVPPPGDGDALGGML